MIFFKKILFICLFVTFYVFLSRSAHCGLYFISIGIVALNLLIFLINMRAGIMIFIPFMLLSEWSSRLDIRSISGLASIHSIYLGPFNMFTYMLVFFSVAILLRKGAKPCAFRPVCIEKRVLFIMGAFFLMALSGMVNLLNFPRQYIADLAPFLNMVCGFILVRFVFMKTKHITNLIWMLLYCLTARAIVGIIWFFTGSGYSQGVVLLPFYDPVGAFPVFLFCLSTAMLVFCKNSLSEKFFLLLVILVGVAFFLMWPSRAQFMVMGAGVLFVALFISTRDRIRYGIFFAVTGVGLFIVLSMIVPHVIGYAVWKISTFVHVREGLVGPTTMSQRLVEGYNIVCKLWEEKILLWGVGAGGWFDDRYFVFPAAWGSNIERVSAFSEEQLFWWKFFKPHDTFLWIFLKGGLLGLYCYLSFLVFFLKDITQEILHNKKVWIKTVLVGLTVPFISMFLGFSPKSFAMAGILYAIIVNVLRIENSNDEICLVSKTG